MISLFWSHPKRQKRLLCIFVILVLFGTCNLVLGASFESIAITIDLCPSHKPYEQKLFSYLDLLSLKRGKPVPVAIAVSGDWLKSHQAELAKIKKLHLDITWVNHSYSHPLFCASRKVNFKHEVIDNQLLMKKYGLRPSTYFRFPGLVYTAKREAELNELGFNRLGADAWLGKGNKIKNGSIVLIHGNGNERPGVINKFIAFLKKKNDVILAGRLKLLSVKEVLPVKKISAKS